MTRVEHFDVAIIGSGIGGTMLAAMLAAQGVDTVVIEAGAHPRFAIGESLVPETSLRLKLLAARFDVPEIGYLGSFHQLRDHVSPACGVKRSFAFVYQRLGETQRGEESNELPTLAPPVGPDAHLLRQDVDAWLVAVAARYGATIRQRTLVEDVEVDDAGARLSLRGGDTIRAKFVVDGTGVRGVVARKLGLRDEEPRLRTDSRALFTHMVDVTPYDAVGPSKKEHGMPVPFSQSTLHHVFDGGWLWVIPFNNHKSSTSDLCSVGLILDRRKWGDAELPAEEEFRQLVAQFPSIARQFEHAKAVRPWVSTGRLQYSSSNIAGARYCLLPHAAGFVDPLYSSGLAVTVGCLDLLTRRLVDAVRDDSFSSEHFNDVDTFVQAALSHYDVIVSNSFDSWRHYETWNAWNRVWALGNYLGTWGPLRLLVKWKQTGDRRYVDALDNNAQRGLLASQHPEFMAVCQDASKLLSAGLDGSMSPKEAADAIFARIGELDFIPGHVHFSKAHAGRSPTVFTLWMGLRHVLWYQWRAPKKWRAYCAFPLRTYVWMICQHVGNALSSSGGRLWRSIRDIFWPGNNDWRQPIHDTASTKKRGLHEHNTAKQSRSRGRSRAIAQVHGGKK